MNRLTYSVTLQVNPPTVSSLPVDTALTLCEKLTDWTLSGLTEASLTAETHPLRWATALETTHIPVRWQSTSALSSKAEQAFKWGTPPKPFPWPNNPTILALIPHWQCEPWLSRCLTSLLQQTHPLTHIVVIDDASPRPPLEIVKHFEGVTLLRASERVGPYRLIQSVIEATDYDAYLFQDADDWSSCDRTEHLLKTARASGAELVGCQEIRVIESTSHLQAVGYPLDVNQALAQAPGHPLLHPTSLVTRSLVQRAGGFATGLKFGGDTEFLLRAHWLARIVNSPRYCYFRRKRSNSLTTALATGLESPARKELIQAMKQRAIANAQAARGQESLDLSPLETAPSIELSHCWGPLLRWHKENLRWNKEN